MCYRSLAGTAAELGVRQLPWVEAHPVNGRNPDFSLCSRGSVHPSTPNSAAVPASSRRITSAALRSVRGHLPRRLQTRLLKTLDPAGAGDKLGENSRGLLPSKPSFVGPVTAFEIFGGGD